MRGPKLSLLMTGSASVWAAVLSVLSTPFLLHVLGFEAYGLIGLYMTLQITTTVLDFGLSATFTRELARRSATPDTNEGGAVELAATLEMAYGAVAVALGTALTIAAPFIASLWIKASSLSEVDVTSAVRMAGVAIALQFPTWFYSAGMMGMQRLVLASAISIPMNVLRVGGSVAAVWFYAPTVHVFFAAQIGAAIIQLFVSRWLFWRAMPVSLGLGFRKFKWARLIGIAGLSAKVSGVNISTIIVTQADKLIASKLLTLEQFGSYVLASTLAAGLTIIIAPVAATTFPRLAGHAVEHQDPRLAEIYHAATQLLIVIVVPMASLMALFSTEVLLVWTRNPVAAANSHLSLTLLAVASGINGCLGLLYPLELAHGRTAPALWSQSIGILVLFPVTYLCIMRFGQNGAGCGLLLYAIGMLVWRPASAHRDLAPADRRAWFVEDVGPPLAASLTTALALKYVLPVPQNWVWLILLLGIIWCAMLAMAALASWRIRSQVRFIVRRLPVF